MSIIDTKKGVPGVPLAALDAIQDQNTRQVLRAIVDGWHVRNGSSGDGKSRFITAAELGDLSGQVGGLRMLVGQVQQEQSKPKTAAEIRRIITDLEASVMESVLFKELGDRITLIDLTAAQNLADGLLAEATARQAAITNEQTIRQAADTSLASQITTVTAAVGQNAAAIQNETTARVAGDTAEAQARQALAVRVGAAESAIVTEQTARTNADNAIVSQVNTQFATVNGNLSALQTSQTTTANNVAALSQSVGTLQVQVGNNTVALQSESTVRANADNDIYAKYSVKIDNNGYVTGFGLISTSNNSAPFSEFLVRADRFAIGSPSGPDITPAVPFIVLTTPDAKGNQPGVYMRNAMIANAAIGTAQIDDLSVNTLKIDGNAVSYTYSWDWTWPMNLPADETWVPIQPRDNPDYPYVPWEFTVPNTVTSARVILQATSVLYPSDSVGISLVLGLFVDGTLYAETATTVRGDGEFLGLTDHLLSVGPGVHTIELYMRQDSPWTATKGTIGAINTLVAHIALK